MRLVQFSLILGMPLIAAALGTVILAVFDPYCRCNLLRSSPARINYLVSFGERFDDLSGRIWNREIKVVPLSKSESAGSQRQASSLPWIWPCSRPNAPERRVSDGRASGENAADGRVERLIAASPRRSYSTLNSAFSVAV
jgi:hypothetical protein